MKSKLMLFSILAGCSLQGCMTYEKRVEKSEWIDEFRYGYAVCKEKGDDGEYFFIDKDGKRVSEKYYGLGAFENGYAIAYKLYGAITDRSYVIIDTLLNKYYYPLRWVYGNVNEYGNLWVDTGVGIGLINVPTGSFRTPLVKYIDCVDDRGLAVVRKIEDGMYCFAIYDGQGNEVVPFDRYTYIGNFSHGLAQFSTTGHKGIYDVNEYAMGSDSFHKKKDKVTDLEPPKGTMTVKARLGYIDKSGKVVIKEQYDRAGMYNESGYAEAGILKGEYGIDKSYYEYYLDTTGKRLTGRDWYVAKASFLDDGEWIVSKGGDGDFLVNNKGSVKTVDKGSRLAILSNYLVSKKGNTYKAYKMDGDNIGYLFTFKGSGRPDEIIGLDGEQIGVYYNGRIDYDNVWRGRNVIYYFMINDKVESCKEVHSGYFGDEAFLPKHRIFEF